MLKKFLKEYELEIGSIIGLVIGWALVLIFCPPPGPILKTYTLLLIFFVIMRRLYFHPGSRDYKRTDDDKEDKKSS